MEMEQICTTGLKGPALPAWVCGLDSDSAFFYEIITQNADRSLAKVANIIASTSFWASPRVIHALVDKGGRTACAGCPQATSGCRLVGVLQ